MNLLKVNIRENKSWIHISLTNYFKIIYQLFTWDIVIIMINNISINIIILNTHM